MSIFSTSGILILSSHKIHSSFDKILSAASGAHLPRILSSSEFISFASDCSFLSLFKRVCCSFISPCLFSSFATVPGLSPTFFPVALLVFSSAHAFVSGTAHLPVAGHSRRGFGATSATLRLVD